MKYKFILDVVVVAGTIQQTGGNKGILYMTEKFLCVLFIQKTEKRLLNTMG